MALPQLSPPEYWAKLQINQQDLDALQTHLLEVETPLTGQDLTPVFVAWRIRAEQQRLDDKKKSAGRAYVPREHYAAGESWSFLPWIGRGAGCSAAAQESIPRAATLMSSLWRWTTVPSDCLPRALKHTR